MNWCKRIENAQCGRLLFEWKTLLDVIFLIILSELYYKDVTITQSQENVSEALKVICCLLDKAPWQLGVMSSSKGIISGPLRIELPDNIIVDCGIHKTGS